MGEVKSPGRELSQEVAANVQGECGDLMPWGELGDEKEVAS